MPLFRRSAPKEAPPVMPGLAAYELGVWQALDGCVPLTDPATIARYAALMDVIPNRSLGTLPVSRARKASSREPTAKSWISRPMDTTILSRRIE